MNYKTIIFCIIMGAVMYTPTAFADTLSTYLADDADTAIRVRIIAPEIFAEQQKGIFQRIFDMLGIRKGGYARPEIGTVLTVQSSAYAPSPYQTDATPCITAAGTRVRPGVVATNFLPIGTILEVNGERFIVEDRMNPRFDGYYLDLWFPSTSEAREFGRQTLEITIVEYGEAGQDIRGENNGEEIEEEKGIWNAIKGQFKVIGSFLGTRSTADPDRFDEDCF